MDKLLDFRKDGQECESCTYNWCYNHPQLHNQLSFSCTNLEADEVYDFCDDNPNGSVFEVWSTEGDENGIFYNDLPPKRPPKLNLPRQYVRCCDHCNVVDSPLCDDYCNDDLTICMLSIFLC
jgi:hypothetical protein